MSRDFDIWMSNFRDSIADYGYYIDFDKVYRNVDGIKIELNMALKTLKRNLKPLLKDTLRC